MTQIQETFQRCWERHPILAGALPEPEKLRKAFESVETEDLWDCTECTFVGYVLVRCEHHWGRAWTARLTS